jgi:hypothetical protein
MDPSISAGSIGYSDFFMEKALKRLFHNLLDADFSFALFILQLKAEIVCPEIFNFKENIFLHFPAFYPADKVCQAAFVEY